MFLSKRAVLYLEKLTSDDFLQLKPMKKATINFTLDTKLLLNINRERL